ncbi:hypothetical protein, partial [Desertihabitans aurantiacus]|uniref:hypothetical protein n=1 Tax=Desertihabitans aurantiacus TaxID=2282477 RepID=UPI001E5E78AF
LVATLVGFGLHLPFWVLLAAAVAAGAFLVRHVVEPADPPLAVLPEPGGPAPTRQADPRVRVLESQLWGAERGMNLRPLHTTLTDLVEARRRRPGAGPLPPTLAAYLSADPPPTPTRRQLRTILEEIRSL